MSQERRTEHGSHKHARLLGPGGSHYLGLAVRPHGGLKRLLGTVAAEPNFSGPQDQHLLVLGERHLSGVLPPNLLLTLLRGEAVIGAGHSGHDLHARLGLADRIGQPLTAAVLRGQATLAAELLETFSGLRLLEVDPVECLHQEIAAMAARRPDAAPEAAARLAQRLAGQMALTLRPGEDDLGAQVREQITQRLLESVDWPDFLGGWDAAHDAWRAPLLPTGDLDLPDTRRAPEWRGAGLTELLTPALPGGERINTLLLQAWEHGTGLLFRPAATHAALHLDLARAAPELPWLTWALGSYRLSRARLVLTLPDFEAGDTLYGAAAFEALQQNIWTRLILVDDMAAPEASELERVVNHHGRGLLGPRTQDPSQAVPRLAAERGSVLALVSAPATSELLYAPDLTQAQFPALGGQSITHPLSAVFAQAATRA